MKSVLYGNKIKYIRTIQVLLWGRRKPFRLRWLSMPCAQNTALSFVKTTLNLVAFLAIKMQGKKKGVELCKFISIY